MTKYYTQCKLRKPVKDKKDVFIMLVSWIPSKIAKIGNIVMLKEKRSDEWSEGWEVLETWLTKSENDVKNNEMNYKHQRKMSDV